MSVNLSEKIKIEKRKIKYLRIEVRLEGIKVILPKNQDFNLNEIFEKYNSWIRKKKERLRELKILAKKVNLYHHKNLEEKVKEFIKESSKILKTEPKIIVFRKMKKRWGSCNFQKKKIIFNKDLKFLPSGLIKYIVFHEMCHLLIKNHKKEFWLLVKKLSPNYLKKEKILSAYRIKLDLVSKKFLRR